MQKQIQSISLQLDTDLHDMGDMEGILIRVQTYANTDPKYSHLFKSILSRIFYCIRIFRVPYHVYLFYRTIVIIK
jgi:hypothetical protein